MTEVGVKVYSQGLCTGGWPYYRLDRQVLILGPKLRGLIIYVLYRLGWYIDNLGTL